MDEIERGTLHLKIDLVMSASAAETEALRDFEEDARRDWEVTGKAAFQATHVKIRPLS